MNDTTGTNIEVRMVHVQTRTANDYNAPGESYAFADDVVEGDDNDDVIVENLAETFAERLRDGVLQSRESLDDLRSMLAAEDPTETGSASTIGKFLTLFRESPQATVAKKLQIVESAQRTLDVLHAIADEFPNAYEEYRQSASALNYQLRLHPGYQDFQNALHSVALDRNLTPEKVSALLNDPVNRSPEILHLRAQVTEIIHDPSIHQYFTDTETKYSRVDAMIRDTHTGLSGLSRNDRMDLTAFRPVEDIARKMANGLDSPLISRPGGINMSEENGTLKEGLQRIAESVRKILEQLFARLNPRAGVSSAGPSFSP